MRQRAIDELARAVVAQLGAARRIGRHREALGGIEWHVGGATAVPQGGVGPGGTAVPLGRGAGGGGQGAHEVADLSWRMPLGGHAAIADPADTEKRGSGNGGAGPAAPVSHLPSPVRIADLVDHTLLAAEATRADIDRLCDEALEHRFAAVCVNGVWVSRCTQRLQGSGVKVATVVGFPLGAMTSAAKTFETSSLVDAGADELDMVAAIGHILDDDWDYVEDDIRAVVAAAGGRTVKVILETATLEPLQIVKASAVAKEAGAQFVKTSTGFHPAGGATPEAVALMHLAVGDAVGVKAAGGVRDCATALRMMAAGATRIGTSSGVALVECLGPGLLPLGELLSDPSRHERVCRTASCPESY